MDLNMKARNRIRSKSERKDEKELNGKLDESFAMDSEKLEDTNKIK